MIESMKLQVWDWFAYLLSGAMALVGTAVLVLVLSPMPVASADGSSPAGAAPSASGAGAASTPSIANSCTAVFSADIAKKLGVNKSLWYCDANSRPVVESNPDRWDRALAWLGVATEKWPALFVLSFLIGIVLEAVSSVLFRVYVQDRQETRLAAMALQRIKTRNPVPCSSHECLDGAMTYRRALHEVPRQQQPVLLEIYQARFALARASHVIFGTLGVGALVAAVEWPSAVGGVVSACFCFLLAQLFKARALSFWDWMGEAMLVAYAKWLEVGPCSAGPPFAKGHGGVSPSDEQAEGA